MAKFYKKACDLAPNEGFASFACYNTGVTYDYGKDGFKQSRKEAARYYKLACDNEKEPNYISCYNLGLLYYDGEGVRQDMAETKYLYSLACDNDIKEACYNLGIAFEQERNLLKAKEYKQKACKLGISQACNL
ncbi:tetratricopeptide repeat protein [Campylobacter sp. 19-13652]|uniref:tetratricopeptide repeat protein n=1 Tax=Campylobacter sp. 19-13652 TaxID=2840180 RepID=UPI001C7752E3|nr:tetratricopeptide repeat protein [Campylobacter sp. 19-13652]BCX80120.1 hypothetical protein LBC_15820 [Campylobacter sp. 19-13652]BCX80129.1 hypothetical protein LBC_15910 [Campylobacter sp. 19-13652]